MKNFILFPFLLLFLFSSCQEVDDTTPVLSNSKRKQPIIIVNKNRHLNMAEFWIDKLDTPNKILMSPKEIKNFNNKIIYEKKTFSRFQEIPYSYNTSWIKKSILNTFNGIKAKVTHFSDGSKVFSTFYKEIKDELNIKSFYSKNIVTRYALTVNYTNQKVIPTELSLLKRKEQIHFDRNQNSALDIGTAIAILHTSKDGFWHYGIGPTSSGWIRNSDIAFGEKEEIVNFLESKKFIITTATKTAIHIAGSYHDYVRMGVRFPLLMSRDEQSMILVPSRDQHGQLILSNAMVKTANIHKGYLTYTAKNILEQAFKFLHLPYGWGGMYGEQDCSKFLQEIYATVGINLPRNSTSQSNASDNFIDLTGLSTKTRAEFLQNSGVVGASIIHLKGHITLYLGEYKGEPYIIHTVWGSSSRHFALGRTAVTSLNFNHYLKKIDKITNIMDED